MVHVEKIQLSLDVQATHLLGPRTLNYRPGALPFLPSNLRLRPDAAATLRRRST